MLKYSIFLVLEFRDADKLKDHEHFRDDLKTCVLGNDVELHRVNDTDYVGKRWTKVDGGRTLPSAIIR